MTKIDKIQGKLQIMKKKLKNVIVKLDSVLLKKSFSLIMFTQNIFK